MLNDDVLPGASIGAGRLERTDKAEGRGEEVVEATSCILKTIPARRRVAHFHSRLAFRGRTRACGRFGFDDAGYEI